MIKIEKVKVEGFEPAIRGMRNPKNSWAKSDSRSGLTGDEWTYDPGYIIGDRDHELAMILARGGPVHAKYRRMIVVYADITAPLYWWKEFDTYKVGTVANSCSTMHKIHEKDFTREDFSIEYLDDMCASYGGLVYAPSNTIKPVIACLNACRQRFLETHDKRYWYQMIQLLPSSYNQRRTVMISYEVLANIYHSGRRYHKLDEWRELCKWIESLPYSEIITLASKDGEESV